MITDRFDIQHARRRRQSGSALIMVLAVAAILSVLIADFGVGMRSELRAAGGHYEGAMNFQLARSAFALARQELNRANTTLYTDERGNAFLVTGKEDFESQIDELQAYRKGLPLGRGMMAYRLIYKPNALDPNAVSENDWHRLLDVACGIEEGDEQNSLVDAFKDWTDVDDLARANGAEEEFYRELNPPRHVKNGPVTSPEELLLVYGFTPEMLYGYGNPARIEEGILVGGGLIRYIIGDNSIEGAAARKYIIDGIMPAAGESRRDDEDEFRKIERKPTWLTLIAEGYVPQDFEEEIENSYDEWDEDGPSEPVYTSRHIILVKLRLVGKDGRYIIADMQENASAEEVARILAYGVPGEDDFEM